MQIAECAVRAPIEESRKWGLYYTTNLLFKTYFKVDFSTLTTLFQLSLADSM